MVDFTYYTQEYLGVQIPEKAFARCMARAREALEYIERCFQVTGGQDARALALCAMAEGVYELENRRGVQSASVGSVSVRYEDSRPAQLWRELYDRAAIYLDICRGVG